MDIDKYTIELEQGIHEAIHRKDWEGNWNNAIMKKLSEVEMTKGSKLTEGEMLRIGDEILDRFKLPKNYIPYKD